MSATVDITGWHPDRVAGFVEAIRGDHPSVEIEFVLRHHDTDRQGQLSLSLSHDEPTDLVARRCETCQTVTVPRSCRSPPSRHSILPGKPRTTRSGHMIAATATDITDATREGKRGKGKVAKGTHHPLRPRCSSA